MVPHAAVLSYKHVKPKVLIRVDTILTWHKFTWLLLWMCENCCTIFLSKSAKSVEHFKHFLKWHYNFQQSVWTYRWVCRIGWTLSMLSLKKKKKNKSMFEPMEQCRTTRLWMWLVWSLLSLKSGLVFWGVPVWTPPHTSNGLRSVIFGTPKSSKIIYGWIQYAHLQHTWILKEVLFVAQHVF